MRQRREIAARADRALFRNDRMHTAVEHFAKQLDDFQTDPAESEREHVGAKQHHGAHLRLGKRLANAAGMAADEIELELSQFVLRHVNIGEFTETCVNAVNHGVARDDLFDDFAGSSDARTR